MLPPLDYLQHRRACQAKQSERSSQISNLPSIYHGPITASDRLILKRPIAELVQDVQKRSIRPVDILRVYGKVAVKAHAKTNCLTEVMIPDAESWAGNEINLKGPLAGIPISLKDTVAVKGFDTSVGYSCHTGKPAAEDGTLVKILKEAGAVPYVKTALPITLLSFESSNSLWGRCTNPHNSSYSPGGSTGGEGALLALGGRIGIGTDVAGSVRAPAHFSGIYSLRCSTGRWPKRGLSTSMAGQEGVPAVASPMTRTLDDLVYFTRAILDQQVWRHDHTVHPIPWRNDEYSTVRTAPKLRIGVMRTDAVIDPSPACARALDTAAEALRGAGHELVDVTPSDTYDALVLASVLLNTDGGKTFRSFFRTGEANDPGAAQLSFFASLPSPVRYLYYLYVRYVRRDPLWAGLLRHFGPKSAVEQWTWVARREAYRAKFLAWWQEQRLDLLLTPPNATPAVPHGAMRDAVSSCGYTFLFNLVDYPAGIVPVTKVDKSLDGLPRGFRLKGLNGIARGAYMHYDAVRMHGLPVAVQVVGPRLMEERVLAGMEVLESALEGRGERYQVLEVE